jgi:O-antigen/teichoic acid export membrane protein
MAPIDSLNGPITNVSQPGLCILQDNPERYRRYYAKILMVIALLTMPVGLFFAIYAPEVTLLMLGPDWMAAAPFLRIFACAAIIRPAIATSANVLITCGKSQMLLKLTVLHCVVLLVMLILGIRWGAIGVAFAHFSTTCLLALPKLYYSFRGTPVSLRTFGHALAGPVLASSALAVALLALRNILPAGSALSSISWALLTALIIYPASLLVWDRSRWEVGTLLADLREALTRRRAAIP